MKNLWLFLCVLFVIIALNGISQEPPPQNSPKAKELIYIRIQEKIAPMAVIDSYMQITYPDQTTRLVELGKIGIKSDGADENGKKIQWELNIMLNMGYEITSTSMSGDLSLTTTVMFLTRNKPD